MSELKREALAHYIKPASGLSATYSLIGKRMSSLSVTMNGSFEQGKDITGQSYVTDNGYSPELGDVVYYANPDDTEMYAFLENITMNRLSGSDAKVKFLEVIIKDTSSESHDAWEEDAIIEIVNYGNEENFTISYRIHPDGGRTKGTATIDKSTKKPTFSPAA